MPTWSRDLHSGLKLWWCPCANRGQMGHRGGSGLAGAARALLESPSLEMLTKQVEMALSDLVQLGFGQRLDLGVLFQPKYPSNSFKAKLI